MIFLQICLQTWSLNWIWMSLCLPLIWFWRCTYRNKLMMKSRNLSISIFRAKSYKLKRNAPIIRDYVRGRAKGASIRSDKVRMNLWNNRFSKLLPTQKSEVKSPYTYLEIFNFKVFQLVIWEIDDFINSFWLLPDL